MRDQAEAPALPGEGQMLPEVLPADPFSIFMAWFGEALARRAQPNPNAMTLATTGDRGAPTARVMLCKEVDPARGAIVFYTSFVGRKSRDLDRDPRAAAVFHWDEAGRQVRIEGVVTRTSAEESDAYFATRPWQSRIGAWASEQSAPVTSRGDMIERVAATMRRFGIDPAEPPPDGSDIAIPRPPNWGGWRLWASRVELWVSAVGRVHDRAEWVRAVALGGGTLDPERGPWSATRLQP